MAWRNHKSSIETPPYNHFSYSNFEAQMDKPSLMHNKIASLQPLENILRSNHTAMYLNLHKVQNSPKNKVVGFISPQAKCKYKGNPL